MTSHDPTNLTLDDWIAALERSEAQHDRGQTVPLARVLERLDENLSRIDDASNRRKRDQVTPAQ